MATHESQDEQKQRESLATFHDFARNLGEEIAGRGLTEEELLAELEATKREAFEERYGRRPEQSPKTSPFVVRSLKLPITKLDILEAIRESRERF